MKVVCAWCNKTISPGHSDDSVSHGICRGCAQAVFVRRRLTLKESLDKLDIAVITVDGDATAIYANQAAGRLVGKKVDLIKGQLIGDVFECVYARRPGGCGRTIHCSGCAIRQTVQATYQDGKARRGVEAEQLVRNGDEVSLARIRLSAEKVGDVVLLVIDELRMLDLETTAAG